MNRTNNWKELLSHANEELKPKGYSIRIIRDGSGCYTCKVYKGRKLLETYAENYYEDELSDLVTEAWHDVLALLPENKTWKVKLGAKQLETIADAFHSFKDFNRGDRERILAVMQVEKALAAQTGGAYRADTTYDVKE